MPIPYPDAPIFNPEWKDQYVKKIAEEVGVSVDTVERYLSDEYKHMEKARKFDRNLRTPKTEPLPKNESMKDVADKLHTATGRT